MKTFFAPVCCAFLLIAGGAEAAKAPAFTATCPTGITASSDGNGRAMVNGKRPRVKAVGNAWEIKGSGVTISVGGDPLSADYTGPHRAHGVCEISAQSSAPAPAQQPSSRMPSPNEQACLQAVTKQSNNGDVVLLGSETSEANDTVYVGVGQNRAKWKCLVKRGRVSEVSSMTNEGGL